MGVLDIHWRGGVYHLDGVDATSTLSALRSRVAEVTGHGISPSAMRLLHAGRLLPGGDHGAAGERAGDAANGVRAGSKLRQGPLRRIG